MRVAIIAAVLTVSLPIFGADDIAWGPALNGLRLGIHLDRGLQEPPGAYARAAIDWPPGSVDRQVVDNATFFCAKRAGGVPLCLADPGPGPAVHVFVQNTGSAPMQLELAERAMHGDQPKAIPYVAKDTYAIHLTVTSPAGTECPVYDQRGDSPESEPSEGFQADLSVRLEAGATREMLLPVNQIWRRKFEPVVGLDALLDQHYSIRASLEPGIRTMSEEVMRFGNGACGAAPQRSATELLSGEWPSK